MMRRLVLPAVLLVALVLGGTAAYSKSAQQKPRVQAKAGLMDAAAAYVGLTRRELGAELRKGQSLAQVTVARGKTVEGLKQALVAAYTARVNSAVAAGTIDARQARRLLARAPAKVERMVNRVARVRAEGSRVKLRVLAASVTYLGVPKRELARELRAGKSLAQIARDRGKSVEGLEQALFAAFKTRVEAAVAAGTLDATRAQRLLERAPARIERIVHRTRR